MRCLLGVLVVLCLTTVAAADPVRCTMRLLGDQVTLGVPFNLEVTVENTSDEALTMPPYQGTPYEPNGWCQLVTLQGDWSETRPPHPLVVMGDADDTPAAKEPRVLGPKSSRRFTAWTWWGDLGDLLQGPRGPILPQPGKARLLFSYIGFRDRHLPADPAAGQQPKFWRGYAESPEIAVDLIRAEPAKVVAATLAIARAEKAGDVRHMARETLADMTCRYFGKGPGLTDEDLPAAANWLEANKDKGRQAWIAAALSSNNKDERWCAACYSILVKDPALADALVAALVIPRDVRELETYDKVLETLWTNYDDPRALDFARKVLREEPFFRRKCVVRLAFKHKIQPIMKEASEALPGWIAAETYHTEATDMVQLAGELKIVQAIPVLERLDREGTVATPVDFIRTLHILEGANYMPRLIQHVQGNKNPEFRASAAYYLGRWGDDQCIDALIAALSDPVPWVRAYACEALSGRWVRGNPTPAQYDKAMETLINMLVSDEAIDRGEVERAMMWLNDPSSVPREPDRKKAAEFWRGVWQNAHMKK